MLVRNISCPSGLCCTFIGQYYFWHILFFVWPCTVCNFIPMLLGPHPQLTFSSLYPHPLPAYSSRNFGQGRRFLSSQGGVRMDGHNPIYHGHPRNLHPQTIPDLILGRFLPGPGGHCGAAEPGAVCNLPRIRPWHRRCQPYLRQLGPQPVLDLCLLRVDIGTLPRQHRCGSVR